MCNFNHRGIVLNSLSRQSGVCETSANVGDLHRVTGALFSVKTGYFSILADFGREFKAQIFLKITIYLHFFWETIHIFQYLRICGKSGKV
jgi:hypothetical protein